MVEGKVSRVVDLLRRSNEVIQDFHKESSIAASKFAGAAVTAHVGRGSAESRNCEYGIAHIDGGANIQGIHQKNQTQSRRDAKAQSSCRHILFFATLRLRDFALNFLQVCSSEIAPTPEVFYR